MDALGHVLVGLAVTGEWSFRTVAWSLAPDIASIPLQFGRAWKDPPAPLLRFYRVVHSPLSVAVAWGLGGHHALVCVLAHLVADIFTHEEPYSDLPMYQWSYEKTSYWVLLTMLMLVATFKGVYL